MYIIQKGFLTQKMKDKVISIGPQTTQALRDQKIPVLAEAKTHNLDGLLETIKNLSIRPETRDRRPETEKPIQEKRASKPLFRSSASQPLTQRSASSVTPRVQRFAPKSPRRR